MITKEQHKTWKSYSPRGSEIDLTECDTVSRLVRILVFLPLFSCPGQGEDVIFLLGCSVSTCLYIERGFARSQFF